VSIPDPIPESVDDAGNPNIQARRRQNMRWLLLIGTAAVIGAGVFYAVSFRKPAASATAQQKTLEQRTLATANVASPAQLSPEAENTRLRSQVGDLQLALQTAQQQNSQLQTENAGLGQQLATVSTTPRSARVDRTRAEPALDQAGPDVRSPGGAAPFPQAPGAASPLFQGNAPAQGAATNHRSIRVATFDAGDQKQPASVASPNATTPAPEKVSVYDSNQYVAPNSYVQARVLVGVDMQAGISATADPKPVLFRIEGRAVGVGADGQYQTSDLTGCLVNGAAFAELSSEKVYIKLQKISCPLAGGRYLVTKVDGYVTYMGKSGVRGRVVSREGNFANKAFVAGTLQGLGQAMSTNTQRNLTGVTTANGVAGVAQAPLTDSQIAQATLGTGISNASSMLADYYIKRAEQYQPVIEMPTGLQVELVFLDGFRFTTKDSPQ
jgi:conjugal transfer pilus assembly protein TraB